MDEDRLDQILREEEVLHLFEHAVPEVEDGRVEIKAVARRAPWRTKIAVYSRNKSINCIAACAGDGGRRIRQLVEQMGGERIDLVRWDPSLERFIANAFLPAEIRQVIVKESGDRAFAFVDRDQLWMVLGFRRLNRELTSRLCGCEIEIVSGPDASWTVNWEPGQSSPERLG